LTFDCKFDTLTHTVVVYLQWWW